MMLILAIVIVLTTLCVIWYPHEDQDDTSQRFSDLPRFPYDQDVDD